MAEHSAIGWTDATWPIVAGCNYKSPGCSNCWAVRDSWRLAHSPHERVRNAFAGVVRKTEDGKLVWTGTVRPLPERLDWPKRWKKGRRIFVCDMADLFDPGVPDDFIAQAFAVMAGCPQHTFQVLTKDAERMRQLLAHDLPYEGPVWPLPNVHIGVTAEDQVRADQRIPELLRTPAAVRWLSLEPLLGPVDLRSIKVLADGSIQFCPGGRPPARVDWVVCGGESAQTRATTRPFDVAWARHLLLQCRAAGVPFFMKQLGTKPIPEALPGTVMRNTFPLPIGKTSRYKWAEPEHWPADLRVQEFPA